MVKTQPACGADTLKTGKRANWFHYN